MKNVVKRKMLLMRIDTMDGFLKKKKVLKS